MIANHSEKLDAAVRPGRVDNKVECPLANEEMISEPRASPLQWTCGQTVARRRVSFPYTEVMLARKCHEEAHDLEGLEESYIRH